MLGQRKTSVVNDQLCPNGESQNPRPLQPVSHLSCVLTPQERWQSGLEAIQESEQQLELDWLRRPMGRLCTAVDESQHLVAKHVEIHQLAIKQQLHHSGIKHHYRAAAVMGLNSEPP